jgi:chromosome segregation protein
VTRLKELRLHGFKTFADPTRFVFERGVTAVIGPNGSGKSNMADAVRWVLGEQSNRSLRTRRAEDVIFGGSQGRRPLGMAEAILTLDNADQWLPIEFGEVSIGRRTYRSGESEYLINGTRARLKEVVELLAGGRLGANELVVVGQGTVDAALSLRPEERRQLFEEAAGVKNLQVRKNEATGRLNRARDNLTRVADLMGELKPQVRRLALQAQHQQEHDALGQRARALVVEAHRRREANARSALGEARRRRAAAEAALAELHAAEAAGRQSLTDAEARYWSAEEAARAASRRREESREAHIRAEAAADALTARGRELAERIAREEAELAEVTRQLSATVAPGADDPEVTWQAAADAERAWRRAVLDVEEADRRAAAAESALGPARAAAAARLADAARRDEAAARAAARAERLAEDLAAAIADADEAARLQADAEVALATAIAAEEEARDQLDAARREADAADRAADEQRAHASALAEQVGRLRAELAALEERAESGGALAMRLAATGWPTLLDAIKPPADAWAAIEAVVGGQLQQALLLGREGIAERAAESDGSARLLADASEADAGATAAQRSAALGAVNGVRTLAEWVGSDAGPLILTRTVVAPDLDALLDGWRRLPPGWCAVTVDGDLADGRGLVLVRGRRGAIGGEAARQAARRRELGELVGRLEAEQRDAASAAGEALVAASEARRHREAAAHRRIEADQQVLAVRGARDRAADGAARTAERKRSLERERASSALHPTEHVAPADGSSGGELERLTAEAEAAHRRRESLAVERDRLRTAFQEAQAAADAAGAGAHGGRYGQALLEARRDQLEVGLGGGRAALQELETERAAATAATGVASEAAARAEAEREAADAARDQLRAELLEVERRRGGAAVQLADLERAVQVAALEVQRLDDELVAIGRERDLAIESLPPATIGGETDEPGGDPTHDLAGTSQEVIDAELARVRRTLAQIGSVNPFAIEEHREVAERLGHLAGQEADLTAAISATEQLIERLETEITAQFSAAFLAIGAKFDEFCRLLFAGGSASLQMSEAGDEGGSGGIEIAVRPPGKRLQRLAMLSGGERALAGVALLFAMLSVNPVPFCILDEVDAALDEANIGRFADALRKLSESIDFVVITHNRATIETADTIYGVTMTDAAVSRVLSLRLADIPIEAAVG